MSGGQEPSARDLTVRQGGEWRGSYGVIPTPGHGPHDRGTVIKDRKDGAGVYVQCFNGDWKDVKRALGLNGSTRVMPEAERLRIREEIEREERSQREKAAKEAARLWGIARPADERNAYLGRKRISANGARALNDELIVPLTDFAGNLVNLQRIRDEKEVGDGKVKRPLQGGPMKCVWTPIGAPIDTAELIVVAEGFATAASIAESIPHAAVVAALSCWNLGNVAVEIRRRRPDATVIMAADDDCRSPDNPGVSAAKAAAKAAKAFLAVPSLPERAGEPLDFSDVFVSAGPAEVAAQILAATPSTTPDVPGADVTELPNVPEIQTKRTVTLSDGGLADAVDQVNEALAAATQLDLYRTTEGLVYVHLGEREIKRFGSPSKIGEKSAPVLKVLEHVVKPLDVSLVSYYAAKCVAFQAWDGRAKAFKAKDCPDRLAKTVRSLGGHGASYRDLDAIVNCPQMRPDGTIMAFPGYDRDLRTLFVGDAKSFPQVKDRPTMGDAKKALETLGELLAEFPFVRDAQDKAQFPNPDDRRGAARSGALAAMLTVVSRHAVAQVPAFGISARAPGSGKSYLADLFSALSAGRKASVYAYADSPEEFEKRLDAALLAHESLIAIDNVAGGAALGHPKLEQIITQPEVVVRRLGGSDQFKVRPRGVVTVTGNNLLVRGDMTRRILMITLDAETERPELREFKSAPVADVLAERGLYVQAALTVLRAFVVAGKPTKLPPLGSFEDWSDLVRSALVWLGEADPVRSMEIARASDPEREQLHAMLDAWHSDPTLSVRAVTAGDIIKRAKSSASPAYASVDDEDSDTALFDALRGVAPGKGSDICPIGFGRWLAKYEGRRVTIGEGANARVVWFELHGTVHKVKAYRLHVEVPTVSASTNAKPTETASATKAERGPARSGDVGAGQTRAARSENTGVAGASPDPSRPRVR